MTWKSIIATIVQCEIDARYDQFRGWSVSARGLISVIAIVLFAILVLQKA